MSVDHKTGRIEHLFVAADARGKGIGQKMLDFARKKLEEHEHPTLTVLDQNTRAIAPVSYTHLASTRKPMLSILLVRVTFRSPRPRKPVSYTHLPPR